MFKAITGGKALSPQAVATSITKCAEMELAEHNLARLKQRRAEVQAEQRELYTLHEHENTSTHWRRAGELKDRELALGTEIVQARSDLLSLRTAHAKRVETTLADRRRAAAKQIIAALESIQQPIVDIIAINLEIEAAGGHPALFPTLTCIEPVLRAARRYHD
jgi:hypothetical protein